MDKVLVFLQIEVQRPNYAGYDPKQVRNEATDIIDTLYADWVVQTSKHADESNLTYAYRLYNLTENGLATSECQAHFQQFMDLIARFQSILVDFKLLARDKTTDDDAQRSTRDRMAKVITSMTITLTLIVCNNRLTMLRDRNTDTPAVSTTETTGDFVHQAPDRSKNIHRLLYHCLGKLADLRARRHAGYVMVPHITRDGYNSSAYSRYCTIDQFPDMAINQTADRELWDIMVEAERNRTWLVKILNSMNISEFPDLRADRHVFAFENGIYNAMTDQFDPYTDNHLVRRPVRDPDEMPTDDDVAMPDLDLFDDDTHHQPPEQQVVVELPGIEIDTTGPMSEQELQSMMADNVIFEFPPVQGDLGPTAASVPPSPPPPPLETANVSPGAAAAYTLMQKDDGIIHGRVACKYFEGKQFDPNTGSRDPYGWRDIDTEDLDRVLKEQLLYDRDRPENYEWPHGRVYEVILAMMGRMVFNVGEMDEWQVAPFFKGVAGSGKSTLLKIIKSFYNTNDVAIMSNNIEQKFGLHPLSEKYVTLCYEMRSNFGLDQAELQCIISGEELTLAVKNKLANVAHTWTSPFAAAGNMLANWEDSQGSIARRFLLIEFIHQVQDSDPQLFSRMEKNISAILLKCVRAYREMASNHRRANLWNKKGDNPPLPDYFHRTRAALSRTTNSLVSFIESSGEVQIQKGARMQWTAFKDMYNRFCKSSGVHPQRLNSSDSYQSIFEQQGLSLTERPETMKDLETGNTVTCIWIIGIGPTMMVMMDDNRQPTEPSVDVHLSAEDGGTPRHKRKLDADGPPASDGSHDNHKRPKGRPMGGAAMFVQSKHKK